MGLNSPEFLTFEVISDAKNNTKSSGPKSLSRLFPGEAFGCGSSQEGRVYKMKRL